MPINAFYQYLKYTRLFVFESQRMNIKIDFVKNLFLFFRFPFFSKGFFTEGVGQTYTCVIDN